MNIRKLIDYSAMYTALNTLVAMSLPQIELYHEIGKLVSARTEKGAAVAAAEYLSKAYPDVKGFSPRNLRRMRDFYRAYEDAPEVLAEAMKIGWTQNAAILEGCKRMEERMWYIRAVRQFGWTKAELLEKLHDRVYMEISLDPAAEMCYTKKKTAGTKSIPDNNNSRCSLWQGPDEKNGHGGEISNRVCSNKRRPYSAQPSDQQGPNQPSKQAPYSRQRSRWKPPPKGYRCPSSMPIILNLRCPDVKLWHP